MSRDDATIKVVLDGSEKVRPPAAPLTLAAEATKKLMLLQRRARLRATHVLEGAGRAAAGDLLGSSGDLLRSAFSSPKAMILFGLTAGAVATERLLSGRPLAGTGEELNRILLGDRDDKARALRHTREYMESNEEAMIAVGRAGGDAVPEDIKNIGLDYYKRELRKEKGLSKLREAFPADNVVDMLILRMTDGLRSAWTSVIEPAVKRFVGAMEQAPTAFTNGR
jgi:hypothetical protein